VGAIVVKERGGEAGTTLRTAGRSQNGEGKAGNGEVRKGRIAQIEQQVRMDIVRRTEGG